MEHVGSLESTVKKLEFALGYLLEQLLGLAHTFTLA